MLPEAVDVLIVGYGPVGAALSALLGRYGVRTLVIDREAEAYKAPRAIALDNEALRILQMIGVIGKFETTPIPRIHMYSPYVGHFATMKTDVAIDGHLKLVTFYQPDLDRALRSVAQSHACVTAAVSTQLVGFTEDATGITATLRCKVGATHAVRAKFLVGADGANSQVRSLIGLALEGESYDQEWLIVDAQGIANNIDHVEFYCDPKRPWPHMCAPGGRTRWEFMLQPGETREQMESDESIRKLLARWPEAAAAKVERKAVYRFQARSSPRYSKGRVFLCGDAAHVTPPFAGQGLVSGLRDVANLAWKLAWVTRGDADAKILDSYDEERRPHAIAMIDLARNMGSIIMPSNALKAILIQGLMKLLRFIPPVRRFLEDWGPKPKNEFASGLFVKEKGALKHGAPIPQHTIDGALSDELLGSGLTLVSYGTSAQLNGAASEAWRKRGGSMLNVAIAPAGMPTGWCAVVRPDRVVLHDGPAGEAARVTRESLALFGEA